jgi:hypothetical protein
MTIDFRKIIALRYRGILLDAVVFLFQLALMRILVRQLGELIHDAHEDVAAKAELALFFFGLCFLQPVGAMLKRRRVSQRLADEEYEYGRLITRWMLLRGYAVRSDGHGHLFNPDRFR